MMNNRRGQAVVELAFVLPLLLAFTFAVVDYGRLLYAKNSLVNAARSGSRAAAVLPGVTSEGGGFPLSTPTCTAVKNNLCLDVSSNTVNYQLDVIGSGGTTGGPAQTGDQVRVTLTLQDFRMITPFAAMMALAAGGTQQGSNTMMIVGQASMRHE